MCGQCGMKNGNQLVTGGRLDFSAFLRVFFVFSASLRFKEGNAEAQRTQRKYGTD